MNIDDLKANPNNPRTLSNKQGAALSDSLQRYGDLGGIVLNRTTGHLVGGHMRVEMFKKLGDPQVHITQQYEQPNSVGTIAIGYVLLGDEQYSYREVVWSGVVESAANLAANRNGGDWDDDKLANMIAEINRENDELLHSTGFTDKEIDNLLQLSSDSESDNDDDDRESIIFSLPSEQVTVVMQALNEAKIHIGKPTEFSDEVNGEALLYIARNFLKNQSGSDDDGANFA